MTRNSGWAILISSSALWLFITICFIGVWDIVAAITTFPYWMWALGGLSFTALGTWLLRTRHNIPLLLLMVWVLTACYFSDNFSAVIGGLIRGSQPNSRQTPGAVRVVSLNCASSEAAAREVMQFQPDIVLLQESPTSNKLQNLSREWFGEKGSFVAGLDCAIVSHYPMRTIGKRMPVHYTAAIITVQGEEALVTSLRLTPPLGRTDLWRPSAWRAYKHDRQIRRGQLKAVLEGISMHRELRQIIGGDFNAPAGDAIYRLLRRYEDAHRSAGRGWGNTALNTIPLFRPDQIYLKGSRASSSYAVETKHSDHRMVVVDVIFAPKK